MNSRASTSDKDDIDVPLDPHKPPRGGFKVPANPLTVADLDPSELADFQMLSPKDQEAYMKLQNHYAAEFEAAGIDVNTDLEAESEDLEMDRLVADLDRKINAEIEPLDFPDVPLARREVGLWADGEEDDEFAQVEDPEVDTDDSVITSVAHNELGPAAGDQTVHQGHRLGYAIASNHARHADGAPEFAKPFQPPTGATPLRFRYTTYMGEHHPAARKVVVQFCTKDLSNLTEQQRQKLLKLVGPRYNPDTDVVKMSCEQFEAPAQNKRYLGDLVKKLLDEAKNDKDTLEDIPLDLRHHKSLKKLQFPEEWKINPSRARDLSIARQEQKLLDAGQTVQQRPEWDGRELVNDHVRASHLPTAIRPQRAL